MSDPIQRSSAASLERVRAALAAAGRRMITRGDHIQASCPGPNHSRGDRDASLSIDYKPHESATFVWCHGGCDTYTVLELLGLADRDLYDEPQAPQERPRQRPRPVAKRKPTRGRLPARIVVDPEPQVVEGWQIAETYEYADAAGETIAQAVREHRQVADPATGEISTEKRFWQRWPSKARPGIWVSTKPRGFTPVLWHLPDVLAAVSYAEPVALAEGEKDARRLRTETGICSTTNPAGAGNLTASILEPLRGAAVVRVYVDHDLAGYRRAIKAHELLSALEVTRIVLLVPAVRDRGADVSDHFDAGHSAAAFGEITIEDARHLELVALAETAAAQAHRDLTELRARQARAKSEKSNAAEDTAAAERWADEIDRHVAQVDENHRALDALGQTDADLLRRMSAAVEAASAARVEAYTTLGRSLPAPASEPDEKPAKVLQHPASARRHVPSTRIPMSRGQWRFDTGEGDMARGVYTFMDDMWAKVAPLPFIRSRIIRRDGTGRRCGTDYLVATHPTEGRGIVVTHATLRDGSWANDLGLPLSDDDRVMRATSTAIRLHAEDVPEREATPRIDDDGRIAVPVPDTLPTGYLACAPAGREEGLAAWAEIIAASADSPRLALTLGASAVAPFLRALRRQSHVVALYGDSDQGKTTTLILAGAVWGDTVNRGGVLRPWDTSPIGIVRYLGTLGVLPPVFDEAGMAPMKTAVDWGRLIYTVCEGAQRTTAESRGPGIRVTAPWDGVVISAGNGRMTDGLGSGKYAGVAKRVIDLGTPFTTTAAQAEALTALVPRAYGHAGTTILERYAAGDVSDLIDAAAERIGLPEGGNARTVAKHLHAHAAGAAMLDAIAGTGTTLYDAACEAAATYLDEWTNPLHDADRVIAAVRDALSREPAMWPTVNEYREHRQPYRKWDSSEGRPELPQHGVHRSLSGVRADDGSWVAVFAAPWHELCDELGIDESVALRELFARGVLTVPESRRRRWEWTTPIKGVGGALYKLVLPEDLDDHASELHPEDSPATDDAPTASGQGEITALDQPAPCGSCGEPASHALDGQPVHLGGNCPDTLLTAARAATEARPAQLPTGTAATPPRAAQSAPGPTPASPAPQETPIGTYTSRDGLTAATDMAGEAEPCLICEQPGRGVIWHGRVIHITCWENSTAEQRATALTRAPRAAQKPAAKVTPRVQTSTRAPAGPAVAVTRSGIVLADGDTMPLPAQVEHVGHLAQLAHNLGVGTTLATWKGRDGSARQRTAAGQVWIDDHIAARLGLALDGLPADAEARRTALEEATTNADAVTAAVRDGWNIGGKGDRLRSWTRIWRDNEPSVHLVVQSAVDHDLAVLADDPDAATLMHRLARYAETTGYPFHTSAQSTGVDWMIGLRWRERDALFPAIDRDDLAPPAVASNTERDINWTRKPLTEELDCEWVMAFDRGGSHAAGIAGLELGYGTPEHHPNGLEAIDYRVPGYFLIDVPDAADWRIPHPFNPTGRRIGAPVWLTTPTLEQAAKLGYEPSILEAYTWPSHKRILEPWYEGIRDARTALDNPEDQPVRDLLKQVYTRTIGQLGSHTYLAGRPGYAPERRHHLIANARANLLRRVIAIGEKTDRWPLAILNDTVLYAATSPDPSEAWPGEERWFGRGMGQYKFEGGARMADHAQFLTGDRYEGKPHLIKPGEWSTDHG